MDDSRVRAEGADAVGKADVELVRLETGYMHLIRSIATAYANGHRNPAAQIRHGPDWAGWRSVEGKWAPASVFQLTQPTNGRWGIRTSTSLAGPRHAGRPLGEVPGVPGAPMPRPLGLGCPRRATTGGGELSEDVVGESQCAGVLVSRDAGSNLIDETQKKNGEERAGIVLVWDAGMYGRM